MSFLDLIKDTASDITTRAAENKVEVKVTSGKKNLDLGLLESRVVIRQNQDGYIYFDDINGLFKITAYQWEGPVFQTVTRTTGTTSVQSRAQSRGREKRTGRLTGAVVGTVIAPGAGTLIGAMVGTGNKKSKGISRTAGRERTVSTATSEQEEVPAPAYMTVKDPATGAVFTFGFDCDSIINGEILNLLNRSFLQE